MKEERPCVCVCVMVLISISGARMCLVCLYQIHNFISNVLIRVYVRMWPGVRKTEMKSEEKADKKRADRQEAGRQEEQSEGEVREDKDEDDMVERGAENSDVAVTRHQFSKPNQPDPKLIAKQSLPKYTLSFQAQWYQKFPWLHVSPGVEGVLCFYCSKAFNSDITSCQECWFSIHFIWV